jgi:hypothetical protein
MLTSTPELNDMFLEYEGDVTGAASFANDSVCGGKTDWFLGSLGEMKLLMEATLEVEISGVGEMYWTSTSSGYFERETALAIDLGNYKRIAISGTEIRQAGVVTVYELNKAGDSLDIVPAIRPIRSF